VASDTTGNGRSGKILSHPRGGDGTVGSIETLEVLAPGPLTTVQDLGRFGFGRYGVAPSGALDSFSLRIGNLLVGNQEDEACLEITLFGLKLKALTDAVISITGADIQPHVNAAPLKMWCSHILRKGDTLFFRGPKSGCRAYLALGGGISVPSVLRSKSTNLSTKFGGLNGRPLQKGDLLSSHSPRLHKKTAGRSFDPKLIPCYPKTWVLKAVFGPQDDHFPEEAKNLFRRSSFKVTLNSDRTGIRLAGPAIQRKAGMEESIISEGVVTGTIQIPGDGQPIIILGELVTGGYRKIATVITADLPFLGQIKPGDGVKFKEVSLEEAFHALKEAEEIIRRFREALLHCSPNRPPLLKYV
jgi:antagonist of KipI